MPFSFPCRPLLALPLMAPLFGCADKPRPIVLRPHAAPRTAHRAAPRLRPNIRVAAQAAPAPSDNEPQPQRRTEVLSPEEKESLFRDFDNYLSQPGRRR